MSTRSLARMASRSLPRRSSSRLSLQRHSLQRGLVRPQTTAWFSDDSHSDFAPKRKAVSGEDEAIQMIEDHVKGNPIMLYMKGNPSMPLCGFSARVVQVLQAEGVDFSSVNVLDYPAIREGVKKYSEWPTIPQLYVNGEFIGGCDIVTAMHESGELKEVLAEVVVKSE